MKAMILAAGLGTRMRPLSLNIPKSLLRVKEKELIVWHLEKLKNIGVVEIVINIYYLGEMLVEALGNGSRFGVNIKWSHQSTYLGVAGGIINALPLLGNEPFILVSADIWSTIDYRILMDIDLKDNLTHLILITNPIHNLKGDFAIKDSKIYIKNGILETFTYTGISLVSPKMFSILDYNPQSDLLPYLIKSIEENKVSCEISNSCIWYDVGTPERLKEVNELIIE